MPTATTSVTALRSLCGVGWMRQYGTCSAAPRWHRWSRSVSCSTLNRCPSSSLLPEPFLRMDEIYLDHAATTPVRFEVMQLMLETMRTTPANPSSVHRAGQRARRALEAAREQAAAALARSEEHTSELQSRGHL